MRRFNIRNRKQDIVMLKLLFMSKRMYPFYSHENRLREREREEKDEMMMMIRMKKGDEKMLIM